MDSTNDGSYNETTKFTYNYKYYLWGWVGDSEGAWYTFNFFDQNCTLWYTDIPSDLTKGCIVRRNTSYPATGAWSSEEGVVNRTGDINLTLGNYIQFNRWGSEKIDNIDSIIVDVIDTNNSRRIYFDSSFAANRGDDQNSFDSATNTYNNNVIYYAYIFVNNDYKAWFKFYQYDTTCTLWYADIPITDPSGSTIVTGIITRQKKDTAGTFESGNGFYNKTDDITNLNSNNFYTFTNWESGKIKYSASNDNTKGIVNNNLYHAQNNTYLIFENYGTSKNTVYVPLDENMGYDGKRVFAKVGTTFYQASELAYEFTLNNTDGVSRSISILKDTIVSAKIYNPYTNSYYDGTFGYSDTETGTNGDKKNLFEKTQDGKIHFLNNANVNIYFKVWLTESNVSSHRWWFSYNSNVIGDVTTAASKPDESFEKTSTLFSFSNDGDKIGTASDESLHSDVLDFGTSTSYTYFDATRDQGMISGKLTSISGNNSNVIFINITDNILNHKSLNKANLGVRIQRYTVNWLGIKQNTKYLGSIKLNKNNYMVELPSNYNGNYFDVEIYDKTTNKIYFVTQDLTNAETRNTITLGYKYEINSYVDTTTTPTLYYNDGTTNNEILHTDGNTYTLSTIGSEIVDLSNVYFNLSSITSDLNIINIYVYDASGNLLNENDPLTSSNGLNYDESRDQYYFSKTYKSSTIAKFKIVLKTFKIQTKLSHIEIVKSYTLTRNFANTSFEEYVYSGELSSQLNNNKYVVSIFKDQGSTIGSTSLKFYGYSSSDDSIGIYKLNNENCFVLFTPNSNTGYQKIFYNIYDESDTLIGTLYYDENRTEEKGYQSFVGNVPLNGKESSYFYIKSSGENPEIVGVFLLLSDGSIKHVSGTENAQMSSIISILGSGSSVLENVELPVSDQVYASIQDPSANASELIYPYYLVGDFNNWRISNEYGLIPNGQNFSWSGFLSSNQAYYYMINNVYIEKGQKFKISNGQYYISIEETASSDAPSSAERNQGAALEINSYDFTNAGFIFEDNGFITVKQSGYYNLSMRYWSLEVFFGAGSMANFRLGYNTNTSETETVDIYFKNEMGWDNVNYYAWNDEDTSKTISEGSLIPLDGSTTDEAGNPIKQTINGDMDWYKVSYKYSYADIIPNKIYFYTNTESDVLFDRTIDLDFNIDSDVEKSKTMFFTPNSVNGKVATQSQRTMYVNIGSTVSSKNYVIAAYLTDYDGNSTFIKLDKINSEIGLYQLNVNIRYKTIRIVALVTNTSEYTVDKDSNKLVYVTNSMTISPVKNYYYLSPGDNKTFKVSLDVATNYLNLKSVVQTRSANYYIDLSNSTDSIKTRVIISSAEGNYLCFDNLDPSTYVKGTIIKETFESNGKKIETELCSLSLSKEKNLFDITYLDEANKTYQATLSSSNYTYFHKFIYSNSTPYLFYLRTSENWSSNKYGLLFDKDNDTFVIEGITLKAGIGIKLFDYSGKSYAISTTLANFKYDENDRSSLVVNATSLYTIIARVSSDSNNISLNLYTTESYFSTLGSGYSDTTLEVRDEKGNLVGSYPMIQTINARNFYYDVYLKPGYELTVYDPNISFTNNANVYTLSSSETSSLYRVYFASTGGMASSAKDDTSEWKNWKHQYINIIKKATKTIEFSPSAIFNGAYITTVTDAVVNEEKQSDSYNVKINEQTNLFYVDTDKNSNKVALSWNNTNSSSTESATSVYSACISTTGFNETVYIYDKDLILIDKMTIVFPGSYYVYYCQKAIYRSSTSDALSCVTAERIQGESVYSILVGEVEYDENTDEFSGSYKEYELNNNYNINFDEYSPENNVSISNNIDLKKNPIYVIDDNYNIVTLVDNITVYDYRLNTAAFDKNTNYYVYENGQYVKKDITAFTPEVDYYVLSIYSTSHLESGVYKLNYSIDNRRRKDDQYFVFTYLTFTRIPSSPIRLYYYQDDVYNSNEDYYASEVYVTSNFVSGASYELTEVTSFDPNKIYYIENSEGSYDQVKISVFEDGKTYYTLEKATTYDPSKTYYTYLYSKVNISSFLPNVDYYYYAKATEEDYSPKKDYYVIENGNYVPGTPNIVDQDYYVMKKATTFNNGLEYYVIDETGEAKKYIKATLKVKDGLYSSSSFEDSAHYVDPSTNNVYKDNGTNNYVKTDSVLVGTSESGSDYYQASSLNNSYQYSLLSEGTKLYTTSDNNTYNESSNVTISSSSDIYKSNLKEVNKVSDLATSQSGIDASTVYYKKSGNDYIKVGTIKDLVLKDGYYNMSTEGSFNSVKHHQALNGTYYVKNGDNYEVASSILLKSNTYYTRSETKKDFNSSSTYDSIKNTNTIYTDSGCTNELTTIPGLSSGYFMGVSGKDDYLGTTGNWYNSSYCYNVSYSQLKELGSKIAVYFYNYNDSSSNYYVSYEGDNNYRLCYYNPSSETYPYVGNSSRYNSEYEYYIRKDNKYMSLNDLPGAKISIRVRTQTLNNSGMGSGKNIYVSIKEGTTYDSNLVYYTQSGDTYKIVPDVTFNATYYYKITNYNLESIYSSSKTYYTKNSDNTYSVVSDSGTITLGNTYYQLTYTPSSKTYNNGNTYYEYSNGSYVKVNNSDVQFSETYYYGFEKVADNETYDPNVSYFKLNGDNYSLITNTENNYLTFSNTYYTFNDVTRNSYSSTSKYYTFDGTRYTLASTIKFDSKYYYNFTPASGNYNSSLSYFASNGSGGYLVTSDVVDLTNCYELDHVETSGSKYNNNIEYCEKIDNYYQVKTFDIASSLLGYYTLEKETGAFDSSKVYYAKNNYLTKTTDANESNISSGDFYIIKDQYTSESFYDSGLTYYVSLDDLNTLREANISIDGTYYDIATTPSTTQDPNKKYVTISYEKLAIKIVDEASYSQPYDKENPYLGYYGLYQQYVEANQSITLATYEEIGGYAPDGKAFAGWATALSNNPSIVYADGKVINVGQGEGLVLYPVFTDATYTVYTSIGPGYTIVNTDGSKMGNVVRSKNQEVQFKVEASTGYDKNSIVVSLLDRKNQVLVENLSSSNGIYTVPSTLMSDCYINVSISANTYTITFDKTYEGGTFTLANDSVEVVYGTNTTTPSISVPQGLLEGYSFTGWYYGNTKITNEYGTLLNRWSYDFDVTLVAKFKETLYFVLDTIDSNGNQVLPSETMSVGKGETVRFTVSKTLAGYTLNNVKAYNDRMEDITDTENFKFTIYNESYSFTMPSDTNITVIITYDIIDYSINYSLNGGYISTGSNPTSYNVLTNTFTLINPERLGYTFLGWTGTNITLSSNVTIAKGSTGNRSYFASWAPEKYTVTYEFPGLDSGLISSISNNNPSSYSIEDGMITLTKPTLENYTFVGWYSDNQLKTEISEFDYHSGNMTIYGLFQPTKAVYIDLKHILNNEGNSIYPTTIYKYVMAYYNEANDSYYFSNVTDNIMTRRNDIGIYYAELPRNEYNQAYLLIVENSKLSNLTLDTYLTSNESKTNFANIYANSGKINLNYTYSGRHQNLIIFKDNSSGISSNDFSKLETQELTFGYSIQSNYITTYDGSNKLNEALKNPSFPLDGITIDQMTVYEAKESGFIELDGKNPTNIGVYFVNIPYIKSDGTIDPDLHKLILIGIDFAEFDMSGISFDNQVYVRDGGAKQLFITGLLDEKLEVTYTYYKQDGNVLNGYPVEAGTYKVEAEFSIASEYSAIADNYKLPESMYATLIIYDSEKSLYTYTNSSGNSVSLYFALYVNDKIEAILTVQSGNSNIYELLNYSLKQGDSVVIKDSNGTSYLYWTNTDISTNHPFVVSEDQQYSFYFDVIGAKTTVTYQSNIKTYVNYYLYVDGTLASQFYVDTTFVENSDVKNQYELDYVFNGNETIEIYYGKKGESGSKVINEWDNYEQLEIDINASSYITEFSGEYTLYLKELKLADSSTKMQIYVKLPRVPVYVTTPLTFNDVYLYYWNDQMNNSWRGEKMTLIESMTNNVSHTYMGYADISATSLIFNFYVDGNESLQQTKDLAYTFRKNYYILAEDYSATVVEWLKYTKYQNTYQITTDINEEATTKDQIKSISVNSLTGRVDYSSLTKTITVLKLDKIIFDELGLSYGKATFEVVVTYGDNSKTTFTIEYISDGTKINPLLVYDQEDFLNSVYQSDFINSDGIYYLQTGDFELSNKHEVTGIYDTTSRPYDSTYQFNGIYDGGNKKITYNDGTFNLDNSNGIFGVVGKDGKVANLNIDICYGDDVTENPSGTSYHPTSAYEFYIGSVSSINYGTIDSVNVSSSKGMIRFWAIQYYGGITGLNEGIINNCKVTLNYQIYDYSGNCSRAVGGIAGYNHNIITNCTVAKANAANPFILSDKSEARFTGAIAGIENGAYKNNSDASLIYPGCSYDVNLTLNDSNVNHDKSDGTTEISYGEKVIATVNLELINDWILQDYGKNKVSGFKVSYFTSNKSLFTNMYYMLGYNIFEKNPQIDIFKGTSYIKLERITYQVTTTTSQGKESLNGEFSYDVNNVIEVNASDLNLLTSYASNTLAIYKTTSGLSYKVLSSNREITNYVMVYDKTNVGVFSSGKVMKVETYGSDGKMISIDLYTIDLDYENEIKIYAGATKLIISRYSSSEETTTEDYVFTIKEVKNKSLYLFIDNSSNNSYSWGYDGSINHTDITAYNYFNNVVSSETSLVYVTYFDKDHNIITEAEFDLSYNGNSFLVFENTSYMEISSTIGKNKYVSIIVEIKGNVTNTDKLYFWYNNEENFDTYCWISIDKPSSYNGLKVKYLLNEFTTNKVVKVVSYDASNKVISIDKYSNTDNIKVYSSTSKMLISSFTSNGNNFNVVVSSIDTNKTLWIYKVNETSSLLPTSGMNYAFVEDKVASSTIKFINEEVTFKNGNSSLLVINYDSSNNIINLSTYEYALETNINVYSGTRYILIVKLLPNGCSTSTSIDYSTYSEDKPVLVLDNEDHLSWQASDYLPIIDEFEMQIQIEDWSETTLIYYYNSRGELIKEKEYPTASVMSISLYNNTSYMEVISKVGETIQYKVQASSIDTGKILFIVKNLDDQYVGVWSYAIDLLITSYIPVIYEVNIYNKFTVTCYNSDGIIINTIVYTMNENNYYFYDGTEKIKIVATNGRNITNTFNIKNTSFDLSKSLHFAYDSENNVTVSFGLNAHEVSGEKEDYTLTLVNTIPWWSADNALTKIYYMNGSSVVTIDTYEYQDELEIKIYKNTRSIIIARLVGRYNESSAISINTLQKGKTLKLSSPSTGKVVASWITTSDQEEAKTTYLYLDPSTSWASNETNEYRYALYAWNSSGNSWFDFTYDKVSKLYRVSWDEVVIFDPTAIIFVQFNESNVTNSFDYKVNQTDNVFLENIDISTKNVYVISSSTSGSFSETYYEEFTRVYLNISKAVAWSSYYVITYRNVEEYKLGIYQLEQMKFSNIYSAYYADIYNEYKGNIIFTSNPSEAYVIKTKVLTDYNELTPKYFLYNVGYDETGDTVTTEGEWMAVNEVSSASTSYEYSWYLVGSFNSWTVCDSKYGLIKVGESLYNDKTTYIYYGYLSLSDSAQVKIVEDAEWHVSYGYNNKLANISDSISYDTSFVQAGFDGQNITLDIGNYLIVFEATQSETDQTRNDGQVFKAPENACIHIIKLS